LATTTNIYNELQPQASAPVSVKIGLFPARIVTRLSQAKAPKPYPLPLFTVFCHLYQAQFRSKSILISRSRCADR
jgi:hypothetical protein